MTLFLTHSSPKHTSFDRILPADFQWLLQRDIPYVCKRDSGRRWQTLLCFVSCLIDKKRGSLVGFVAAFCIFTVAPQVPVVVLPVLYEQ